MTYAANVQITTATAIDTAHICYRKARRDCYRIHGLVTHPRTVEAAKIAIWSLYVGAVVAYALGQSARILLQSWVDAQVSSALVQPVAIKDDLPSLPELLDTAAEMTGAEVVQAEIEAAFLEEMIAALEEAEQTTEGQPDYSTLTTPELRRECAAVGIRWKNARGKNRHMTKAQMIAALEGHQDAA